MKTTKYQFINREDIPLKKPSIGREATQKIIDLCNAIPDDGRVLVKECLDKKEMKLYVNSIRRRSLSKNLNATVTTRGLNIYVFKNINEHRLPIKE